MATEERIVRVAAVERNTKETQINGRVDLDGTGAGDIATGIGFLDHMLEQLAQAQPDRHQHCGRWATCISTSTTPPKTPAMLSARRYRRRWATAPASRATAMRVIPMDETLTRVSLDASNRPYLVWKVAFTRPKLGEMDTELFKEWFQAFAQSAGVTLHVENLYGENNHHIVESCFKGLARALRQAVEIDPRRGGDGAVDQGHRSAAAYDECRDRRLWLGQSALGGEGV